MKILCLFDTKNTLESDEKFLADTLGICTRYDTTDIDSLFEACWESVWPYIEILFTYPESSDMIRSIPSSYKEDYKAILKINCALTALQSFTYLQQKDSYSNFTDILKGFLDEEEPWDPEMKKNIQRLCEKTLTKDPDRYYLNQFILLKKDGGLYKIGNFCRELSLQLFLNNQRNFKTRAIPYGDYPPFNLNRILFHLNSLLSTDNKEIPNAKLQESLEQLFQGLINIELFWEDLNIENLGNADKLIYYHNRELIFHSHALLTHIRSFTPSLLQSEPDTQKWIKSLLAHIAIPITYQPSILINNCNILDYDPRVINAALTILLKAFSISLFNQYNGNLDVCCSEALHFLLSLNADGSEGFSNLQPFSYNYLTDLEKDLPNKIYFLCQAIKNSDPLNIENLLVKLFKLNTKYLFDPHFTLDSIDNKRYLFSKDPLHTATDDFCYTEFLHDLLEIGDSSMLNPPSLDLYFTFKFSKAKNDNNNEEIQELQRIIRDQYYDFGLKIDPFPISQLADFPRKYGLFPPNFGTLLVHYFSSGGVPNRPETAFLLQYFPIFKIGNNYRNLRKALIFLEKKDHITVILQRRQPDLNR